MPLFGYRRLSFVPMFFLRVGNGLFSHRFGRMRLFQMFFRVLLRRPPGFFGLADGDDVLDARLDAVKQ
jgi:hypothetical protein